MRRDEALEILRAGQAELRSMGVTSLAIFGSVARDEAGPESDVDILVEVERPMGMFRFLDIKYYLEDLLGAKVDLLTRAGVHPALRDRIFSEALDVV
jgi:predicted nucleotidyltransferase